MDDPFASLPNYPDPAEPELPPEGLNGPPALAVGLAVWVVLTGLLGLSVALCQEPTLIPVVGIGFRFLTVLLLAIPFIPKVMARVFDRLDGPED
jgi:hypothetical protein